MPLPMTLDITLDSQGRGETVMFIDGSAMGQPGKPGTVSASYQGDTLTFTIPSGKDYSATMSGQVSSDGSQLVIKGTYSYTSPPSVLMTAEWQVTR
jgi:hypothetical protein